MRVGIIADIHANLPALEAVIEDMPSDIDAVVCAGDIVGYSAWPSECVERVRDVADVVVQGNHDRDVMNPDTYAGSGRGTGNEMAYQGLQYAQDQLSAEQLSWLEELPSTTRAFDERLYLVHSHPEETDRYVPKGRFTSVATYMESDTQLLVLGHTHHQAAVDMRRFDRHGWVVNPGSVGQPRDNDPRAAYAIANLEEPTVSLQRVKYPIEDVLAKHDQIGLPEQSAQRLQTGD